MLRRVDRQGYKNKHTITVFKKMKEKESSYLETLSNVHETKFSVRHLLMMAIGGTIGAGFFIGTGIMLQDSGPLGTLIAYCIAAMAVYPVMQALGEMTVFMPQTGSFAKYGSRFIDSSMGFVSGWNYWFFIF